MITVRVSDLEKMINELVADKIDYVEISILESEEMEGVVLPPALHFDAYNGLGGGVDYGSIEEIKVDPCYKFESSKSEDLND